MDTNLEALTISRLFDLSHTRAAGIFDGFAYPWEILDGLADFIRALGPTLPAEDFRRTGEDVWIARSARVAASASITGPCIIDEEAEVRHCAFIRGSALVGKGAVVGNSTELKNVLLFDGVQVPHYNYVGDSVLGYKSHMGAGSITSNVKSDKTPVSVRVEEKKIPTGRRKLGAILGDFVEVGCGSILNPGSVIGPHTNIYPLSMVRGFVPGGSIYKKHGEIVAKEDR